MNLTPDDQEIKFRVSLLKEVIIFSHVNINTLNTIAHALTEVWLLGNEALFHKGDQSQSMYIIKEGKVQVHDGDYIFSTLGSREIFGEYSLLDERERSASVTSLEKTILYQLSKEDFNDIIKQKPEIKDSILKMLLLRLRDTNVWEERLAERNKKIEKQKEEIQAQKDLKDKFFSIISHDLRGPVSSFQGISSMIKFYIKENRIDELKQMAEDIDQSANQLSRLLDNLLNWASQQQRQIPYRPEKILLSEMINNLYDVFKSTSIAKKIKLSNKVNQSVHIWADLNSTSTIFRNLINNALKFTEEHGKIEISCSEKAEFIEININDTGVGIPADKLDGLFNLNEKKSTHGTDGEKGVGLGLQLVYEFTKLNKGELAVKSKVGEGTTFTVTLPQLQ